MSSYTYYQGLLISSQLKHIFKMIPYLSCTFYAVHYWHVEIGEDNSIWHSIIICFYYFGVLLLSVDACIYSVLDINANQFKNNFHWLKTEAFIIRDKDSTQSNLMRIFKKPKSINFIQTKRLISEPKSFNYCLITLLFNWFEYLFKLVLCVFVLIEMEGIDLKGKEENRTSVKLWFEIDGSIKFINNHFAYN